MTNTIRRMLTAAGLVGAALLVTAGPASAHATLQGFGLTNFHSNDGTTSVDLLGETNSHSDGSGSVSNAVNNDNTVINVVDGEGGIVDNSWANA